MRVRPRDDRRRLGREHDRRNTILFYVHVGAFDLGEASTPMLRAMVVLGGGHVQCRGRGIIREIEVGTKDMGRGNLPPYKPPLKSFRARTHHSNFRVDSIS